MDAITLGTFVGSLEKWAALTDKENAVFKEVVRAQARFDQAASDNMSEAQKELHRQNTERMQYFLKKKKDSNAKIPGWAADPKGKMPGGSSKRAPGRQGYGVPMGPKMRKVVEWAARNPRKAGAAAGAIYGTAFGALSGVRKSHDTSDRKKRLERAKKHGGPIGEYMAKNPVKSTALFTGLTQAIGGLSAVSSIKRGKSPMGSYVAGSLGSTAGLGIGGFLLDKKLGDRKRAKARALKSTAMTREERNRKRREEYARKPKAFKVPRPTKLKTVKAPKLPKAA